VLAGEDKRDTVDVFVESVQALPGRLEAFLQARLAPAAGAKAARDPLLASKLHADAGDAIRVRPCSSPAPGTGALSNAAAAASFLRCLCSDAIECIASLHEWTLHHHHGLVSGFPRLSLCCYQYLMVRAGCVRGRRRPGAPAVPAAADVRRPGAARGRRLRVADGGPAVGRAGPRRRRIGPAG